MRRVASSWKVIEAVLAEHAREAHAALRRPASERDLRVLERALGRRLPHGLAAALRVHDGMTDDPTDLVDYMSLLPAKRIADRWRMHTQYQREWEPGGDQVTRTRKIKNDLRWRDGWIPFAVTAGGDLMVIDLDPGPTGKAGQVFRWYGYGGTPRRVVADSLPAWLDALAEALLHRQFTLDDMGTINLRRRLT